MRVTLALVLIFTAFVALVSVIPDPPRPPVKVLTHADSVEIWRQAMLSGRWVEQGNGTACRVNTQNEIECVPVVYTGQ